MELPQEMWDNVIDHLWDNRNALIACGTTCKALLSPSRFHIFSTVFLETAARHESFRDLLERPNYVAEHVRSLYIFGTPADLDSNTHSSDGVEPEGGVCQFPHNGEWMRLAPKLSRLLYLGLHSFTFRIPHDLRGALPSLFPSLQKLGFHTMKDDEGSLAALASASGGLSSLIFYSTPTLVGEHPPSDLQTRPSAFHRLTTLVWDPSTPDTQSQGAALLPRLEDARLRLQSLVVTSIGSASSPLPFVRKLLDTSADTLHSLSLEFVDPSAGDLHGQSLLDITRMHSLQSLHIAFHIKHAQSMAVMLIDLCRHLRSPALDSLRLCVLMDWGTSLYHDDIAADVINSWTKLRLSTIPLSLHSAHFRCTVCVRFRLPPDFDIRDAAAQDLRCLQDSETQLMQGIISLWTLLVAGEEGGGPRYTFGWTSSVPPSDLKISLPASSDAEYLREMEWYCVAMSS